MCIDALEIQVRKDILPMLDKCTMWKGDVVDDFYFYIIEKHEVKQTDSKVIIDHCYRSGLKW